MLNFLKRLFINKAMDGYTESLIKAAIERAVEGTDPWLRAVSGYKKKLRPAVLQAMNYVGVLVDSMAPVIFIKAGSYVSNSRLRRFFGSSSDMWNILDNCMTSNGFRRGEEGTMPWIYSLLTMQKIQKSFLGA
jgi:hypothetical protein